MHAPIKTLNLFTRWLYVFLLLPCFAFSQSYTIALNILNTPNENNQVVVIAGDLLEVEFSIADPDNELSQNDILQLIKIDNNEIIAEKKRGKNLTGSVSLNTNGSQGNPDLGEYVVQYIHNGSAIAKVPNIPVSAPIMLVADEVMQDLVNRLHTVEQTVAEGGMDGKSAYEIWLAQGNTGSVDDFLAALIGLKGDKGDQGDIGPVGPIGPQGVKGDQGDIGPVGQIGPQGAKGDQGNIGPVGQIGPQGVKGDQGDAGLVGSEGPKGDKGDQGDAGKSAYEVWLENQSVPTNGLVAYYPFNGNANDESGNGNDGTVYGATLAADRHGNSNSSYIFDGNEDYIIVGNNPILNPAEITVTAWVRSEGYSGDHQVVVSRYFKPNGYVDKLGGYCFELWPNPLDVQWVTWIPGHGYDNVTYFRTDYSLQANTWYFLTANISESSKKVYVNGTLVGETEGTFLEQVDFDFWIGGHPYAPERNSFKGNIDEVRIYNRVLSESEIQQLYNGSTNTPPSEDAYFTSLKGDKGDQGVQGPIGLTGAQ